MSKRKLSLQQKRRIAEQRLKKKHATDNTHLPSESSLGPSQPGIVLANYGRQALIEGEKTQQRCFLRANMELVAGDNVNWRSGETNGVVESRETRLTELQRPDSYGKLRIVAANVSQMLITVAPLPEAHCSLIDRYLVAAKLHQLKAIVIVNKADRLGENKDHLQTIDDLYSSLGYPVVFVSAHSGVGLTELQESLRSETSIFVGQSGVGKSSLIQTLLPEQNIRIGELSNAAEKGKHTTTHSQLYHFPFGGQCIDSPGIREFGLWHANQREITTGFVDIARLAERCRFRDCSHITEPKCAVQEALKKGDLSPMRFDNYQLILSQLDDVTINK